MNGKLTGWDDTIVALATPPGIGAIGVIRLSGNKAIEIVNDLFPSKDLRQQPSHTIHVGVLKDKGAALDEVVVSLYKEPGSYTGEDVVEISGHGSPFVLRQIIEACLQHGARLAKPGEFTQRAFLKGKLDLAQAEAVADLIASNTAASQRTALHNIRGGFSNKLKELREQLIKFSALIELELDFSQEDVEFADRKQFYELINELSKLTDQLINSFRLGNVIKNGVSVAIVGKPNAGKSTLLNALLQEDRAIVSEIPGTTRDTIEEIINIDGILFRLIDTAGIRQHTSDIIETMGVEKSLGKMKSADLVLYVFDVRDLKSVRKDSPKESFVTFGEVGSLKSEMEKEQLNYLLVGNKIDEQDGQVIRNNFSSIDNIVFISAKAHKHLEVLKERMVDKVISGQVQPEGPVPAGVVHFVEVHALEVCGVDHQ